MSSTAEMSSTGVGSVELLSCFTSCFTSFFTSGFSSGGELGGDESRVLQNSCSEIKEQTIIRFSDF